MTKIQFKNLLVQACDWSLDSGVHYKEQHRTAQVRPVTNAHARRAAVLPPARRIDYSFYRRSRVAGVYAACFIALRSHFRN